MILASPMSLMKAFPAGDSGSATACVADKRSVAARTAAVRERFMACLRKPHAGAPPYYRAWNARFLLKNGRTFSWKRLGTSLVWSPE
ncbi:hypothetical protein SAMN02799626_03799 [Caulobacter sp. UNC279MFTsu5.1]|nr:hypothetical protein SAMN02799626_03799 [Caulobacter sp. UNC279MFTsu5.1]